MSRRSRKARRAAQRARTQKRFKARVAAGKSGLTGGAKGTRTNQAKRGQPDTSTIGKYRAAQRARVSSAAAARNKTFQDKRAGLDSQRLGAEATRLTGIPSGADLKPGMLTISDAGKAQAEENKAIKAAKDSSISSSFNANNDAFNTSKFASNISASFTNPAVQNFGQNFGNWFNLGKNQRIANEATAKYGKIGDMFARDTSKVDPRTLFGDDRLQRGMSNQAYKEGKQSKFLGRPDRAFGIDLSESWKQKKLVRVPAAEGGPMSGPTPLIRRLVTDIGKFALSPKAALLASNFRIDPLADGTLEGKPTRFNIDAGGLNIGTKEATTKGDPTGRSIFSKAAGLADFAFNDKTDLDNLGKGVFGKGIVTPQDVKSDIKTSIKKIGFPETLAQGIEGYRDYNRIKNADDKALAFAQNVNADQFAKALRFAEDSKAVQKAGENLGTLFGQKNVNLPSDFKAQIKNVVKGIQEETGGIEQGKVNNRLFMKNRVDEINNLLANVNQNPNLSTLSKIGGQFDPKTNPNADNMTSLQKIAAGFNPESPNAKALSFSDRGIVGSAGNVLVGGKLSDIYRQATGNIEGGANANIPTGQVGLSNADMFNIATSAIKNVKTEGSLSQQRFNEIRSLAGDKGITPTSLIRGVLPQFQRRTGGGNQTRSTSGGAATPQQQLIEELLINQTPTTTTTTPAQTVGNAGNLQNLQQQAYLRALASYGFNPNYFAQVRPRKLATAKPKSFSDYFRR